MIVNERKLIFVIVAITKIENWLKLVFRDITHYFIVLMVFK